MKFHHTLARVGTAIFGLCLIFISVLLGDEFRAYQSQLVIFIILVPVIMVGTYAFLIAFQIWRYFRVIKKIFETGTEVGEKLAQAATKTIITEDGHRIVVERGSSFQEEIAGIRFLNLFVPTLHRVLESLHETGRLLQIGFSELIRTLVLAMATLFLTLFANVFAHVSLHWLFLFLGFYILDTAIRMKTSAKCSKHF